MTVLSKFEMTDNDNKINVTIRGKIEINLNDLVPNQRVKVSEKVIDEIVGNIGTSVREFVKQERGISPCSLTLGKRFREIVENSVFFSCQFCHLNVKNDSLV